jgi:hypothetical protein
MRYAVRRRLRQNNENILVKINQRVDGVNICGRDPVLNETSKSAIAVLPDIVGFQRAASGQGRGPSSQRAKRICREYIQ